MTKKSTFRQKSRNWARSWDGKFVIVGLTLFRCEAFIPGKTGYIRLFPNWNAEFRVKAVSTGKFLSRDYKDFLKDSMTEAPPSMVVMFRLKGQI